MLTIEAKGIIYKSDTCDILIIDSLFITCWFFPRLFRQTAGPWANVEIVDFRIRVMQNDEIPRYVQMLRANIVETILMGEFLCVDDFSTSIRFNGLSEGAVELPEDMHERMPNGGPYNVHLDGHDDAVHECPADFGGKMGARGHLEKSSPALFLSKEQDEMWISARAGGIYINNRQGRYYSFGSIDVQHRRNWSVN
ncbi:hypothetical protein BDY19DRAFT_999126 [Irpex rosettiformis]|uniref:Uncharacterized protein n=1 Tax=Irpex rosettiformis TaxID=378272 RepID=A0ACB8TLL7_9APHY|nr:hypothetical protein BDY19DRAFT_999126 [Irpex rosettiformis]